MNVHYLVESVGYLYICSYSVEYINNPATSANAILFRLVDYHIFMNCTSSVSFVKLTELNERLLQQ